MYMFLCEHWVLISLGQYPVKLLGHMINVCGFLFVFKNCQIIFESGYTTLRLTDNVHVI